jgi:hypothetical protein
VDDSFFVSGFESLGNLLRNDQRFFDGHGSVALNSLLQRVAGNQLHDEVVRVVGMFEAVDRGDVRVIKLCQHLGFALETSQPLGVVGERFGQYFDSHVAPELAVMRLIHFAHSACADGREHFKHAEFCTCG